MSWASATSPMSSRTGRRRRGDAEGGRHRAVDPVRAAVGRTRGGCSRAAKNDSTSRTGIEEATTSVARAGAGRELGATRGSDRPSPAPRRSRRDAVRSAPARPRASRGPSAGCGRAPATPRSALTIVATAPAGSCHACGVERELRASRARAARRAAAWRSGGRRRAARGRARGRPPTRRRAAARRSARRRGAAARAATAGRRAAAAGASARPASASPRPGSARRGRRRDRARVRVDAARRRRAAPAAARRDAGRVDPRAAAGAAAARLRVGQRRAHQRLAQREVEVHRARAAVDRGPERAAGEQAHPAHALGRRRVVVDLEEPLGRAAVELDLVDGLPGAELAQLRRAVRGETSSGTRASCASITAGG